MVLTTHINGFRFGHLFVWSFYRMFWFAICRKFGGKPWLMFNSDLDCVIGIGDAYPSQELWDAGYRVAYCGRILGEIVLHYQK